MAVTETTTIRVRRSTQERLAREAELEGKSLTEMFDAAVDLWEERRLLDSMDESYRKYGDEIHEEMKAWLEMPLDGPTDER
ncbi:MAG TPA: hypothetical protein VMS60_09900 [Solirubrobacterales bacterium]|nr:hypothetical protein [Solirubrobacterales bacterium]HVQ59203.1 hypothetical protein [Solirubrobacterales bacterium]